MTMKFFRRLGGFFALVPALFGSDAAFDRFVDTFSSDWMRANPNGATSAQYFTGPEQDALDRRLTPITREARLARVARAQQGLDELAKFNLTTLDATQRISAAMLEWQLKDVVQSEPFSDYGFVFQQFSGLQVNLVNFLSQTHPVRNRRDIENYLARLELVAGQIDEGIKQASERAAKGFIPPKFILTSTLSQFDRFLGGEPRQNILVTSLDERAAKLKDVSTAERATFVATAQKTVTDTVIPAFRRARALLEAQLAVATDDAGLWRFPGGDKAYANSLRRLTTTDFTPEQIHALGLKEVARIETQMDTLLRSLGYNDGTVSERMRKVEEAMQPPSDPDPRPAMLTRYTSILRDAEQRAAQLFDLRPQAPIEVRREPPFTERSAAAHYTPPANDGSRPGIFWAPLPGPYYKMIGMRTLVYHEGVPGHHFQIALQQEMKSLPRFRRDSVFGFISAHGEGWALYAEQLAAENGWYEGDVQGHLGQLSDELFRARRLVVDTGLHVKHWTRQQAIDFGIGAAEVERYVVWPGQACSYKIGQLKILELRAKAQQALGEKFSMKEFHNVVLRTGGVPLEVLGVAIDDYIRTAR